MKMIKSITILLFVGFLSVGAMANSYKLDESSLETTLSNAEDVTLSTIETFEGFSLNYGGRVSGLSANYLAGDDDKQLIAGIVALGSVLFFQIGIIFPIHRLILGAGSSMAKVWILHCVTIGSCFGVGVIVDGILLLMDANGDQYVNNEKFLMWTGN